MNAKPDQDRTLDRRENLNRLHKVFGNYRAEWLKERVYDLYLPPAYLPSLTTEKPVILEGCRGTGKTTTLLAMSYEGRFAIEKRNPNLVRNWQYYSCYLRMDSNRVGNFRGSGRDDEFWRPIFAHYLNLIMCLNLLDLAAWYSHITQSPVALADTAFPVVAELPARVADLH